MYIYAVHYIDTYITQMVSHGCTSICTVHYVDIYIHTVHYIDTYIT